MSVLFAATHPQRAKGLVLYGSFPRITRGVDYPWGFAPDQVEPLLELAERTWGEGTFSGGLLAPSQLPQRLPFFARLEREAASPGAVMAYRQGSRRRLGTAIRRSGQPQIERRP